MEKEITTEKLVSKEVTETITLCDNCKLETENPVEVVKDPVLHGSDFDRYNYDKNEFEATHVVTDWDLNRRSERVYLTWDTKIHFCPDCYEDITGK